MPGRRGVARRRARAAEPVAGGAGAGWKVSVAPSQGSAAVAALRSAGLTLERWYYDWAGGLIWLGLGTVGEDAGAATIRSALASFDGHATLMRADEAVRAAVPVFHPQPEPLAALSRRVKASFDPLDILNRGRLGLHS